MNDFSTAQRSRVTMLDVAERAGVSKASDPCNTGSEWMIRKDPGLRICQAENDWNSGGGTMAQEVC